MGILTIPNILSISRLIFLPLILLFLSKNLYFLSLIFISLSWLTDAFDGYLARKLNQVSDLGKILDHLVDKIWVGTILVTLVITKNLDFKIVAAIIIRDLLITAGFIFLMRKKNIISKSSILGKITGFLFALLILATLLNRQKELLIITYLTWIFIFLSFLDYFIYFLKVNGNQKS
ncbi:MAG: CDP-alcohol phosphatidyltransferase family protein [candidate division WOR-3 bacterium]